MLSYVTAALSFHGLASTKITSSRVVEPVMVSRRDIFTTAAGVAAFAPLAASAYDYNAKAKAMGTYGQRVLALTDASADDIFAEKNAIETFASQMIRASGKRNVDGRSLGGTPLGDAANAAVAAGAKGDKAGANAAIKELVSLAGITSVPPYGSAGNPVVGGNTFSAMSGSRGTPGTW